MSAIPQPQHRRRWLITCDCGQRFWGSSRRTGRGFEAYRRHWREDHEGRPACRRCRVWRRQEAPR